MITDTKFIICMEYVSSTYAISDFLPSNEGIIINQQIYKGTLVDDDGESWIHKSVLKLTQCYIIICHKRITIMEFYKIVFTAVKLYEKLKKLKMNEIILIFLIAKIQSLKNLQFFTHCRTSEGAISMISLRS